MIHLGTRDLDRMLADWRTAGLIDGPTADRLKAHEAARGAAGWRGHMPPLLLLLGGLAVALGIVALISANWQALPIALKLGLHVLLTAGLALAAWRAVVAGGTGGPGIGGEVLLMLLSASLLALIAHGGQSFQLQGSATGLMAAWLLLATPFTLALARSAFHRWLWTAGLVVTVALVMGDWADMLLEGGDLTKVLVVVWSLLFAAPLAARVGLMESAWARHLRHVALGALALAVSMASLGWYLDSADGETALLLADLGEGLLVWFPLVLGALVIERARSGADTGAGKPVPGTGMMALLILSPLLIAAPVAVTVWIGPPDSLVLAATAFCLFWLWIALLALEAGEIGLFRLAVVLVALRLFIVFLEAAGGLIATGAGLIAAGLLLIAVGYGARHAIRWAEGRRKGGQRGAQAAGDPS
ncbi:MAG: hypothetical protein RLY86_4070 [Pseudomonadota bacterium]